MARYGSAPGAEVPTTWRRLGFTAVTRSHYRAIVGATQVDYWPLRNRWKITSGANVEVKDGGPDELWKLMREMRAAEAALKETGT